MLRREQRISIQDFVSTWLINDWERPLLKNSLEESIVHCTKIEVKSINGPPQTFHAKYVCFTDMRTLVVDASAIKSFGEGADPSSLLMQDSNISDPFFREKDAANVVSLGRPGSILSDRYHYEVLLDDEKNHFTLTSGNVKDVKLEFVHLSGAAELAAEPARGTPTPPPPPPTRKHQVSRRLDITFHDGSGLALFPSELESVMKMVKLAARMQPLIVADAPRERPASLVKQDFSVVKGSLFGAFQGLDGITSEARGLLEKAQDDEITSSNLTGLEEELSLFEEKSSAVTGEATQARTAQHEQKQLWKKEWQTLKGKATKFDERFNAYIQEMESDLKAGLLRTGLASDSVEARAGLPQVYDLVFGQVYDNSDDLPNEDGIGHGRDAGVGVGGPVPPPPPPSPPPEPPPPPPPFSTPPPRVEVMLKKPEAHTTVGIVLIGQPAVIHEIRPDTLAAKSGQLKVGQVLLAVNGENVTSHEDGGLALRSAVGPLKLSVSTAGAGAPTAAPPPPLSTTLSGGAATKSALKSMSAMASVMSKKVSTANATRDKPRAAAPDATAAPIAVEPGPTATQIAPGQPRARAAAPNLGREPEDSGAAEPSKPTRSKPPFREDQAALRRQKLQEQATKEQEEKAVKEKEAYKLLEAAARGDEASVLLLLNANTGIDARGPVRALHIPKCPLLSLHRRPRSLPPCVIGCRHHVLLPHSHSPHLFACPPLLSCLD